MPMLRVIPLATAFALVCAPVLAADHVIEIKGTSFEPNAIVVEAGDTVTFTNTNRAIHTATFDNGSFDTGRLRMGESATVMMEEAGSFAFKCTVHPGMRGTIEVK